MSINPNNDSNENLFSKENQVVKYFEKTAINPIKEIVDDLLDVAHTFSQIKNPSLMMHSQLNELLDFFDRALPLFTEAQIFRLYDTLLEIYPKGDLSTQVVLIFLANPEVAISRVILSKTLHDKSKIRIIIKILSAS